MCIRDRYYSIKRDLGESIILNKPIKVSPGFMLPSKKIERPDDVLIKYSLKPDPREKQMPGPGAYVVKSNFELISHTQSQGALSTNKQGIPGEVSRVNHSPVFKKKKSIDEAHKLVALQKIQPLFKNVEQKMNDTPGPGSYIGNDYGGMALLSKSIVKDSAFRSEVERDMYGMRESNPVLAPGRYDPQRLQAKESFHLNRSGIWMS
eukprot:TRINITY_DN25327_c0_g1_i1.p1 TRINITY_DN25327_c0_g1~~TRINITY_DN25327_c0_g1_i1.p1  ORF type:complete len:225 (-),score=43.32 TRINITY_DN25327_c0_g1_i1:236-853(-)